MTGAREESELTGKGEEARMKAHQIAFVFGHGRGQVVVNQVARNATQRLKCMNMTAHECFEALAVRELDVHHAAFTLHQREGVQLALVAGVVEGAEVPPVDLEAIARQRFHAHVCAVGGRLGADLLQIVLQDGDAALEAAPAQSLKNHHRTGGGILLQQFTDGGVKRLQFAGSLRLGTGLRRLAEVFGYGAPVQVQVAGDLSQRPLLVPVEIVNLVDLFVAQHGGGLILLSVKSGAEARVSLFARFRGRELSPSTINTCVVAKLLLARCSATGPNSQTAAAQDFRSRAELLFARSRTRRA